MWKVEWPLLLDVMNERSWRSKLNRYRNTSPAKCAQHIKWIKMKNIFFSWNNILLCWNNDMTWISLLLMFLAEKQRIICTGMVIFFNFFACLHLTQPPPLEKSSHASRFCYALDFKIDANRIFHKWSNYIVSNKHHYLAAEEEIVNSVCFWCSIIQVQVQWPCARVLPRSGSRPRLWEARTV